MTQSRDRDEHGRPRNARPRDALGRPLPRQGESGDPQPEPVYVSATQTLTSAQRLLDARRSFHAHEVLEAAWKSAPDNERGLWQGLAQIAVGITHAARGNPTAAITLLARGRAHLDASVSAPGNVDVPGLQRWVDESSTLLRASVGAVVLTAPTLRQS